MATSVPPGGRRSWDTRERRSDLAFDAGFDVEFDTMSKQT
jgi:hypothetical protein